MSLVWQNRYNYLKSKIGKDVARYILYIDFCYQQNIMISKFSENGCCWYSNMRIRPTDLCYIHYVIGKKDLELAQMLKCRCSSDKW